MNKISWIILLLIVMLSSNVIATNSDVIITEVMYDPPNAVVGQAQDAYRCANDSSCQWIELYNKGSFAVDLSSWKLKVNTRTNGNDIYNFGDIIIQPDEHIVIATQLGDEDSDGFSLAALYGNKDGVWNDNIDGFKAVDSDIPFIKTPDVGPESNPSVDFRLLDGSNVETSTLIFDAHFVGPTYFVQKNNGYSMERDSQNKFMQSLSLGGSPGKKRNSPPMFTIIPNVTLNEDQVLSSRLLDLRNFASDSETSDNDLVFSITGMNVNPSNLINCDLIGTESDSSKSYFFNCTDLAKDAFGSASIFVSVSDGIMTENGNFSVNVKNVNDAPTLTSVAPSRDTATLLYTYDADAQDIEGNPFNFSIIRAPSGVMINPATGILNWTPAESQVGDHSIEIAVTDILSQAERTSGLTAASSTQKFAVTVDPIFGFSNVDVAYSDGTLVNVNSTQTIPRVFTASDVNVITTLINRHPTEQGVNILMEDVVFNARLSKDSFVIFDREISSGFTMNSMETKQIPFTFAIPRNLSDGVYTLTLKAEGDLFDVDENLMDVIVHQSQTFTLYLEVQQARHDVYISSMSIEEAVCSKQSNLKVDVQNSGSRTERDVQLNLAYSPLNVNFNSVIDKIFPGETKTFFVNVTNGAGMHNITAQVIYSEGTNTNTLVNFESCTRAGDFNKDFCINGQDSELLLDKMGLKSSDTKFDAIFDINQDGMINFDDFFKLTDSLDSECATISPTSDEPKPSVIISGEGFNVEVSQLKIMLQQGSSFVSSFFVTNKENTSLTMSNKLDGIFSAEEDFISFDFPNLLNLLAGSSSSINFKTSAPEQFKLGAYSGTFTIKTNKQTTSLPVEIEVVPNFCESGIKGNDILIDIHEPDNSEDFKPGDKIDVDLSVKNKGETRDISIEGILWNIDKDEEVESFEVDSIEIDKGDTEKDDFDFEIAVPDEIKDDKIVLYIKASEDGNEEQICNVQSVGVDVKRDKNDVRIVDIIAPNRLQCDSNAILRISARNFGKDDEKNVYFRVSNDELGLIADSKPFTLKEFDKNGDFISETLSFRIPVTKSDKSMFIASVIYDDGAKMQSIDKEVSISCSEDLIAESQVSAETQFNEKKESFVQDERFKVVQSITVDVESDLLIQTAVLLSFVLGVSIVAYAVKGVILVKK